MSLSNNITTASCSGVMRWSNSNVTEPSAFVNLMTTNVTGPNVNNIANGRGCIVGSERGITGMSTGEWGNGEQGGLGKLY